MSRRKGYMTKDAEQRNAMEEPAVRSLNLGHLSKFDINEGNWFLYQELLEQYFLVNAIEERRKVSVFITSMGMAAYAYLRDLCVPELPKDKSYEELCNIMQRQFNHSLPAFRELTPEGTDLTWKRHSEQMLKSFGLGISTTDEPFDTDLEGEM